MNVCVAFALIFLFSCGGQDKKEATDAGESTVNQKPAPQIDLDSSDGWKGPCDRRTVQTFELDGATWIVTVPTLCDPTPYIEKGDPPWK